MNHWKQSQFQFCGQIMSLFIHIPNFARTQQLPIITLDMMFTTAQSGYLQGIIIVAYNEFSALHSTTYTRMHEAIQTVI